MPPILLSALILDKSRLTTIFLRERKPDDIPTVHIYLRLCPAYLVISHTAGEERVPLHLEYDTFDSFPPPPPEISVRLANFLVAQTLQATDDCGDIQMRHPQRQDPFDQSKCADGALWGASANTVITSAGLGF
ncbi:hypothetical protein ACTXT7_002511 [Hymenolepis weldensis]